MQAGYDGLLCDKTRPSRIQPLGSNITERVVNAHPDRPANRGDPLDLRHDGEGRRYQREFRPTHLAGARPATAPGETDSSSPTTRNSSTNCATSSASMSIRPPMPSCSRSMRRAKSRHSTAPSPVLPMKPGRAGTMTHDYKRHGTTTLFAALDVLDGTVIGHNMQRHRHQEFIRFLNAIEARCRPERRSTPSSTTTPPTSIRRCGDGSPGIPA